MTDNINIPTPEADAEGFEAPTGKLRVAAFIGAVGLFALDYYQNNVVDTETTMDFFRTWAGGCALVFFSSKERLNIDV